MIQKLKWHTLGSYPGPPPGYSLLPDRFVRVNPRDVNF